MLLPTRGDGQRPATDRSEDTAPEIRDRSQIIRGTLRHSLWLAVKLIQPNNSTRVFF